MGGEACGALLLLLTCTLQGWQGVKMLGRDVR